MDYPCFFFFQARCLDAARAPLPETERILLGDYRGGEQIRRRRHQIQWRRRDASLHCVTGTAPENGRLHLRNGGGRDAACGQ